MNEALPEFRPSPLAGRKQFEVPYSRAEAIRSRLEEHGIAAISVLEYVPKKAMIEVDAGVDSDAVLALLV